MPNYPINGSNHKNLYEALGVRPAAPVPQQPTPTPPSSEGSGVGSLFQALFQPGVSAAAAPVAPRPIDPYQNMNNKIQGKPYR